MQVNAVAQPQVAPQAATGTAQTATQGLDFMAVIAQMLGSTEQGEIPMLNLGEAVDSGEMSEDELMNAMQMLSGLFVNPALTAQPEAIIPTDVQTNVFQAVVQQPARQNDTMVLPQKQSDELFEIMQTTEQAQQTVAPKQSADNSQLFSALLQQQKSQTEQTALPKQKEPLDIDELQVAVDEFRFLGNSSIASKVLSTPVSTTTPAEDVEILAQVKTGILEEAAKGKNEFVIKLKPEGLGEVTVKMLQEGGKISMSIITSNQQAQNALNSQISQLQEALRPLNAEVTQVVTQTTENMFHQGFAEQQHNQAKHQNHSQNSGSTSSSLDTEDESYAEKLQSVLDSYI